MYIYGGVHLEVMGRYRRIKVYGGIWKLGAAKKI